MRISSHHHLPFLPFDASYSSTAIDGPVWLPLEKILIVTQLFIKGDDRRVTSPALLSGHQ
jgi:hypothetical protein